MDPKVLLDNIELGVIALGADGTIVNWNGGATRLLGAPGARMHGRSFWAVFPGSRGTPLDGMLQEVTLDGEPRILLAPLAPDGAPEVVFEVHVSRGPGAHLILALRPPPPESASLITAFETDRQVHRRVFDLLPVPALLLSIDGRILETNAAAAELLGAPGDAALRGRLLTDCIEAREAPLSAALRDAVQAPQQFRFTMGATGESPREVAVAIHNVSDGSSVPKLLFLALDPSQEVLLQRKLLQADRLAQLGGLVSGVAHELNNPLAAIAAFAEVLKVDADTLELKEHADVIHQEAMRAGRVVQTLLEFARQRPRAPQAVDLQDVAERVIGLHRSALRQSRIQAAVSIDATIPAIIGDPQELQQILLNVIMNAEQAIAATGRTGSIEITARVEQADVVLLVEDTGPGIPPAILDRVFEPFFTTRSEVGSGLGLAVSHGLVTANGGRMQVENIAAGGTRVAIAFPAEHRPASTQPALRRAEHPLSVLIVDDEETVRRGLTRMAECLGHRVTSAGSLAEAERQRAGGAQDFDAILIDLQLDEAHSGFDFYQALQREGRGRDRRVIFMSGDSVSIATRDRLRLVQRPVLNKPFNLGELREMLENVGKRDA